MGDEYATRISPGCIRVIHVMQVYEVGGRSHQQVVMRWTNLLALRTAQVDSPIPSPSIAFTLSFTYVPCAR